MYTYVVKKDIGLAPNPFWGYCTLAICTPNHMGIRPQKGDWIIGITTVSRSSKLVYAMQISKTLPFEDYYNDTRFGKKKPVVTGSWRKRCGDNMYYKDTKGVWKQHSTIHHTKPEDIKKDLKHPVVFVAEHFYYFGEKAVKIQPEYQDLIWKRQGCKKDHNDKIVERFLNWLHTNFNPGILGNPYDNNEAKSYICG
ncbi:MAG: hypothetical protein PH343_01700 [Nitrospira sp.]|nr:hypothetical protein [Nitrospira sp.]